MPDEVTLTPPNPVQERVAKAAGEQEALDAQEFARIFGVESAPTEEAPAGGEGSEAVASAQPDQAQDEAAAPEEGFDFDAAEPPQPAAEPEQESQPEPPALSPQEQESYESALVNLRFVKVPKNTLDAMDPHDVIAWGREVAESRAKAKADLDRANQRVKELETASQTPSDTDLPSGVPPVSLDLGEEAFEAAAQKLAISTADAKEALMPLLQAVADATRTSTDAALTPVREQVQATRETETQRLVRENMTRLAVPADRQQEVLVKADVLARTGAYSVADDCFDDACKLVLGGLPNAQESQPGPSPNVRRARKNGHVTPPAKNPPKRNELGPGDQLDEDNFNAIMRGDLESAYANAGVPYDSRRRGPS